MVYTAEWLGYVYSMDGKRKTSPARRYSKPVIVRVDDETKGALDKEAGAAGLDLSCYVRQLIFTHPDRKKRG